MKRPSTMIVALSLLGTMALPAAAQQAAAETKEHVASDARQGRDGQNDEDRRDRRGDRPGQA